MKLVLIMLLLSMSGCSTIMNGIGSYREARELEKQRKAEEQAAVEAAERERIAEEERARREEKERQDAIDAAVIKVPVVLDYSKPWTITLTGDFRASGHDRYFQSGKTLRDGIDCWNWKGMIAFRLYNDMINFVSAEVGTLSTPKPPDHWAYSIPFKNLARWSGTLRIEYDPAGVCRMFRDGMLIGSWTFRIVKMPAVRRELWLRGFEGSVTVE